jgi:hypothetical protein
MSDADPRPDEPRRVEEAVPPLDWSDEIDRILVGDLTAALAYLTPAGGAVATCIAPCGLRSRERGTVGFTSSVGFPGKLERIARNPRVALAYHAREHGLARGEEHVLVQGTAVADVDPTRARREAFLAEAERYLGPSPRGRAWAWLLREYRHHRVLFEIPVQRLTVWPAAGVGPVQVSGAPWSGEPDPQRPPANGTAPRVEVTATARTLAGLPHRLIAYRGADGFPVVIPVELTGHDRTGLRLVPVHAPLPRGERRAGLLAHTYRPRLIGLTTRTLTGWLEVADDGTGRYAPHTSTGFHAPARKTLLLLGNGLLAKRGVRRARRRGIATVLDQLASTAWADPRRG